MWFIYLPFLILVLWIYFSCYMCPDICRSQDFSLLVRHTQRVDTRILSIFDVGWNSIDWESLCMLLIRVSHTEHSFNFLQRFNVCLNKHPTLVLTNHVPMPFLPPFYYPNLQERREKATPVSADGTKSKISLHHNWLCMKGATTNKGKHLERIWTTR